MAHIRQNVLKISQAALADIAGTSQATVSRWETGELEPNREQMERVRGAASELGKPWNDRWFFEVPETTA